MTISTAVKTLLDDAGIPYGIVPHPRTQNSMSTALAARVSSEALAKAVVLKDREGYLMAVMPASCKLSTDEMNDLFGRKLELADEEEVVALFEDCAPGAVPPLASAYGLDTVWDDALAGQKDVYFEGGDHDNLVMIEGADFLKLMGDAEHARFSHHI